MARAWFHRATLEKAKERYLEVLNEHYDARKLELETRGLTRVNWLKFRLDKVRNLQEFIKWSPDFPSFEILKPFYIRHKIQGMNEIIGIASLAENQLVLLDQKSMSKFGNFLTVSDDAMPHNVPL